MDARPSPPFRSRHLLAGIAIAIAPTLMGASHATRNFKVEADSAAVARKVAEHAEACRARIAREWLGRDLAPWDSPCPIRVKLTRGEAGGLTSFGFAGGRVSDQRMTVEGRLDRILNSAIPHEVTHTVFAAAFGGPMPRWADEGASLLSEDSRELQRHDEIVQRLFSRRGEMPLARLFKIEEYPNDLLGFYGQGYSASRFLVEIGGRPRFLRFVRDGSKGQWDEATRLHYGLADTRELDRAWRAWHTLLADRGARHDDLAVRAGTDPKVGPGTVGRDHSIPSSSISKINAALGVIGPPGRGFSP